MGNQHCFKRVLSLLLAGSMLFGSSILNSSASAEEDVYQRFEVASGESLVLEKDKYLYGTEFYEMEPYAGNGGIVNVQTGGSLTTEGGSFDYNEIVGENCMGGAILNYGTVTLTGGTSFSGNMATGENARGGAICNFGTLNIFSQDYTVYFSCNQVSGENAEGGAIYNGSTGSVYLKGVMDCWMQEDTFVNDGTVYWVLADAEPMDSICMYSYENLENRGELVILVDENTASGEYTIARDIYDEEALTGKDSFRICTEDDSVGVTLPVGGSVSYNGSQYLLRYEEYQWSLILTVINAAYHDGFGKTDCSFDTYEEPGGSGRSQTYYGGYTFDGWYLGDTKLESKADEVRGAEYTAHWKYEGADVVTADYTLLLSDGNAYRNVADSEHRISLQGLTYDSSTAKWKLEGLHFVTTANPALKIIGAASVELTGLSGVYSAAEASVGVELDNKLTLLGVGRLYAGGDAAAVSGGEVLSNQNNLHVWVGSSANSTQYSDAYSGESYAMFEQHTHEWTNYQIVQNQYFTYLTADCANSDGGHDGDEGVYLMLYTNYLNQWDTQPGELMEYEMAYTGSLLDFIDVSSLTIYYEGTGDTEYEKTTVKPTELGTYQASVEIGGKTLIASANVKRRILIQADDIAVPHGAPEQSLTYTVEGLGEGESLTGVTLTREPGTEPGRYEINMGIPEENNELYSIIEIIMGGAYYEIQPVITFHTRGGETMEPVAVPYDFDEGYEVESARRSGYVFDGWYLDNELTMPWDEYEPITEDLNLYAKWIYIYQAQSYEICVEPAEKGTVTADKNTAARGTKILVTVAPDKGYTLETLTVTDFSGRELELTMEAENCCSFLMPASKVSVSAAFMEDNTMLNYFFDVKADDPYYDAVLWAAENDITNGKGDSRFAPEDATTRAQMVTFLWRAAGCPVVDGELPFTDVSEDAYYGEAVRWAAAEGIVNGVGGGLFDPDAPLTKAQAITILCRYSKALVSDNKTEESPYQDIDTAAYYYSAVLWAEEQGITENTDGKFSPDAVCVRWQTVTFLYQLFVK